MKKNFTISLGLIICLFLFGGIASGMNLNHEITDIEFRGNENITEQEMMEVMSLEVGEILEEETLRNDLQNIYDLGYFQDLEPHFQQYSGGVRVILEVYEHPELTEIDITGDPVLEKEEIKEILGLNLNEVVNMIEFQNGLRTLEEEYQNKGYIPTNRYGENYHYINYDEINLTSEGVLTLPLAVGYLNDIILQGNEKTRDFVIKRELEFDENEPLQMQQVQHNLQNLYSLNYFEEINPEPLERVEGTNKVNLIINFIERKTGTLNFGGGYSSRDGWIGMFNIKEENFLGYGQTIGFEWEFGGTRDLSFNFEDPRVFGSKMSFGFDYYDRINEREDEYLYEEDIKGGSLTLGYPLSSNLQGSVRFRLENYYRNYLEEGGEDESSKTRSITLQTRHDTRNHPINPTSGDLTRLSFETAPSFLGGDEFIKYGIDTRNYFPGFRDEHAWALRLKSGFGLGDDIPTNEQYRLGGAQTLRGYRDFSFRGDNVFLMNLEYRFPIYDRLSGVVFADSGNTWDDIGKLDFSEFNSSVGVGARINTPIGQLRLDYGFNEDGEGMPHFSIGQAF